jgi:integrase
MSTGYSISERINKEGKKTYLFRVRYKDTYAAETFKKKSNGELWARDTIHLIETKTFKTKHEIKEEKKSETSLGQRFDEYINLMPTRDVTENNAKEYYEFKRNVIKRFPIAKLSLSEIGVSEIIEFMDAERRNGKAENSIRNDINSISRIFTYARSKWNFKGLNPVSLIDKTDKPKKSKPRDRRLEEGEEERILEYLARPVRADRKPAIWLPYLFRFALNSGLRLGETARIESDEKCVREGLVYLHRTKLDNDRWVPLTEEAQKALLDFKPWWGEKTIFTHNEKTLSTGWYEFKKRLLEEGVINSNLTMHDLRHESLSRLFEIKNSKGEDALSLPDIINVSGHKDIKTLIHTYVKLDPKETVSKLRSVHA